jgi:hypothetical protein
MDINGTATSGSPAPAKLFTIAPKPNPIKITLSAKGSNGIK